MCRKGFCTRVVAIDWWNSVVEQCGGTVWWNSVVEQCDGTVWWNSVVEQCDGTVTQMVAVADEKTGLVEA